MVTETVIDKTSCGNCYLLSLSYAGLIYFIILIEKGHLSAKYTDISTHRKRAFMKSRQKTIEMSLRPNKRRNYLTDCKTSHFSYVWL